MHKISSNVYCCIERSVISERISKTYTITALEQIEEVKRLRFRIFIAFFFVISHLILFLCNFVFF
jgi:hypothetical protein